MLTSEVVSGYDHGDLDDDVDDNLDIKDNIYDYIVYIKYKEDAGFCCTRGLNSLRASGAIDI